ncbi:MAG: hypothetical protein QNJ47_10645 [Nostocaceae cyanobacterium]|nr:hypothetical protein [Nostocaceae cyanobacterium]
MLYLTLIEVLELHRRIIEQSGGGSGIRDIGLLEERDRPAPNDVWQRRTVPKFA